MNNYCDIFKEVKTIAVVGISRHEHKTSRRIAEFLLLNNFSVVGVSPATPDIKGIDVYPSLNEIPFEIDLVDVFRKSEDIPELIPSILTSKPKYLWLQLGIRNDQAIEQVLNSGINCIQDKCIKIEYSNCF